MIFVNYEKVKCFNMFFLAVRSKNCIMFIFHTQTSAQRKDINLICAEIWIVMLSFHFPTWFAKVENMCVESGKWKLETCRTKRKVDLSGDMIQWSKGRNFREQCSEACKIIIWFITPRERRKGWRRRGETVIGGYSFLFDFLVPSHNFAYCTFIYSICPFFKA